MFARSLLRFVGSQTHLNSYTATARLSSRVRFSSITTRDSPQHVKDYALKVKALKDSKLLETIQSVIEKRDSKEILALPRDEQLMAAQRNAYMLWREFLLFDKWIVLGEKKEAGFAFRFSPIDTSKEKLCCFIFSTEEAKNNFVNSLKADGDKKKSLEQSFIQSGFALSNQFPSLKKNQPKFELVLVDFGTDHQIEIQTQQFDFLGHMARGLKGQVALQRWMSGDRIEGVKKFLRDLPFVVVMNKEQHPIVNKKKLLVYTDINTAAEFGNFSSIMPEEIGPLNFSQIKGLDLFKEFKSNQEELESILINFTGIGGQTQDIPTFELTNVDELLA